MPMWRVSVKNQSPMYNSETASCATRCCGAVPTLGSGPLGVVHLKAYLTLFHAGKASVVACATLSLFSVLSNALTRRILRAKKLWWLAPANSLVKTFFFLASLTFSKKRAEFNAKSLIFGWGLMTGAIRW